MWDLNMINIGKTIFFIILIITFTGNVFAGGELLPKKIIGWNGIALKGRTALAELLYAEGEKIISQGDLFRGLNLWGYGLGLDGANTSISARLPYEYDRFVGRRETIYRNLLYDIYYGRAGRVNSGANEKTGSIIEILGDETPSAESPNDFSSDELWGRLDKFMEAEDLYKGGQVAAAKMVVDSMLELDPSNEWALSLLHELESTIQDETGTVATDVKKAEIMQKGWNKYLELKKGGQIVGAWGELASLEDTPGLLEGRGGFAAQIGEERSSLTEIVGRQIRGELSAFESKIGEAVKIVGSLERLKILIGHYREFLARYQRLWEHPMVTEVKEKIISEIEKAGRVSFFRAEAVKNISGCKEALSIFRGLILDAAGGEFGYYKKAMEEVLYCEKEIGGVGGSRIHSVD